MVKERLSFLNRIVIGQTIFVQNVSNSWYKRYRPMMTLAFRLHFNRIE